MSFMPLRCGSVALLAMFAGLSVGWLMAAGAADVLAAGEAKPVEATSAKLPYPVSAVTGWVADAKTGKPIGGVCLEAQGGSRGEETSVIFPLPDEQKDGVPVAVTDAQGCYTLRFMIPTTKRARVRIALQDERYAMKVVRVAPPEICLYQGETGVSRRLDVVALRTMTVRVLDPEGKPLVGALVCAAHHRHHFRDYDAHYTDEGGRFAMPTGNTAGGGLAVTVAAPGYEILHAACSPDDTDPVIRLKNRCVSVSGCVKDADGRPAAGVRVFGYQTNTVPQVFVLSDAEGRFTMASLPEKGSPINLWPVKERWQVGPAQQVQPGQDNVVLTTFRTGHLSVAVKDPQGSPVADAGVLIVSSGSEHLRCYVKTDAQGVFVAKDVPVGEYLVQNDPVYMQSLGRQPESLRATVEEGKTGQAALTRPLTRAETKLENCLVARGLLVDAADRPLRHARVNVCHRDQDGHLLDGEEVTDAEGRFEVAIKFREVPEMRGDRMTVWDERRKATAPAGRNQVRFLVTLDPEGHKMPLVHGGMLGWSSSGRTKNPTAGGGGFALEDVLPGIVFDATRDWPEGGDAFDAGRMVVPLTAERLIVLATGPRLPSPAANEHLESQVDKCLDAENQAVPYRVIPARSSDEKGFSLLVRHAGALRLSLRNRFNDLAEVAVPDSGQPGADQPLAVSFPVPKRIELTVVNEVGEPVSSMRWYAEDQTLRSTSSDLCLDSNEDGKIVFRVSGKAAGKFRLVGFGDNLRYEPFEGEIPAGPQDVAQTIKLQNADAEIRGFVRDPAGQPVANAMVAMSITLRGVSTSVNLRVNEQGAYATLLPAGAQVQIHATVEQPGKNLQGETGRLTIASGQKVVADIDLEERDAFQKKKQAQMEAERSGRRGPARRSAPPPPDNEPVGLDAF